MSSPTCPVHGTKLTYPIVPRVSMYGCADCFRDTPFSSWQLTDAPAPLAFDASLDALDVENVRYPEGFAIEIIGLDAVRAAHRAEVERAVAEAVKVERSLAAAVCRYKSSFFHHTVVGKRLSASDCAGECADQIERGDYSDAIKDIAAAIRARGAKS